MKRALVEGLIVVVGFGGDYGTHALFDHRREFLGDELVKIIEKSLVPSVPFCLFLRCYFSASSF